MSSAYRFQFTSTVQDLLNAEDADMSERTCRRSLRWVVAAIGVTPIIAAAQQLAALHIGWETILMPALGAYVVYYFVGASYMRRRRIRRRNPSSAEVVAEFGDDGLRIEAAGYGRYTREWRELVQFIDAARGVLLYFADETVNWLPNRVFTDNAEKKAFVKFLRSHVAE